MRSYEKYLILAIALIFIFSMGNVCANDSDNATVSQIGGDDGISIADGDVIKDSSNEITVDDWDDLQLYCSKDDKNYVLKLKENTNYYPTDLSDESYQIKVNNNVTIVGSPGAYFGDSSPNARSINYLAINVPEYSGIGITLKDITFKWIASEFQPNAGFLQMGGNANNYIENCIFDNITMDGGHSSVVYLVRGDVTLSNCSFTNITSDYGVLSLYDPRDDPTDICTHARGLVMDCYFEGNYARTEPGCINNCGVLVVRNSTFYRNAAFWWAGAIHTHGGANTTIYDSNFTDNTAGWNGGALYTYSYLQIYNTIFSGNNCTTNNGGGAIGACKYLHAPYIHIEDSLFENNENLCWAFTEESTTGLGRGGAISIMDEGELTVLNTTFIKNSASIGTAICAISQGSLYGSPDVRLIGNRFINHTRIGDVLVLKLDYTSICELEDNYYSANSIEFSKLKLTADDRIGDEVKLHIDAALKYSNYYDSDILEKSGYDVYMDGQYIKTVNGTDFTLNLKNVEKAQVYVVPSISTSKSNEVSVGVPREYIYVSQKSGSDANNGTKDSPVSTIAKAIELASATGNIWITDGNFKEINLNANYNLSITGEGATFSSKGNIFTFGDVDVELKNIIFKNSKQSSSSSERIIKHSKGILTLENCTFDSNSYNTLIETDGSIESSNLEFINNNGMLIQANNYLIDSAIFDSNTADSTKTNTLIKSSLGFKTAITNSVFSNNNVKDGCIYFKALDKSKLNTLTVSDCIFTNNVGNDGSSGILMYDNGLLDLKSSLFINNTDSGRSGALILTSTESHIADSIFLGNVFANTNGVLFNSKSSANLKNIYASGNWFGNTQQDYNTTPPVSSSSHCDNWLFLNASADTSSMFIGENAIVYFNLNNVYTKEGNVTYWDSSNLPAVRLDISTSGGTSSKDEVGLVYGLGQTTYTLNDAAGTLTASYESVNDVLKFSEAKQVPEMTVNVSNISVDDVETITINLPSNATGSLTIDIGGIVQSEDIVSPETAFTLPDLSSGVYSGSVTYSGDEYYSSVKKDIQFSVNKYNSTTALSVGQIDVGDDVILTVDVTSGATGNITLIINNKKETLALVNSRATYTISSISRGDYDIKAIYNGDYKYSTSEDSARFSVDKLDTAISVSIDDIVYGQDALIKVVLEETATGNVTINVDGINKTGAVENGIATIIVSNLNAGNKTVDVTYDGDNVFNHNSTTKSFNVAPANTPLTIAVNDIMIGHDANIEVSVLSGVSGNMIISCNNQNTSKSIPRTGKVSWKLSDLAAGTYTVIATLQSNNYLPVENRTEFTVSDFETPQWPNEGFDVQNTGKSPYGTDSNGEIIWIYEVSGNVTGNLAIDSDGNIYLAASNGVYSIKDGELLWIFNESKDGDYSGLAVGRDAVIVPEEGNTLRLINQSTGKKYGNSNIYLGSSKFAPVVDSNGTVYISSEYQYASEDYKLVIIPYKIWETGGNPTLINLGKSAPNSAPVIVNDNIVVIACVDGLKVISLAGGEIIFSINGNNNGIRPVVGPGNMIYAVLDNNIVEVTPQGNVIWKSEVSGGVGNCMALNEELGLYCLNSQGNLYAYDLIDGSETLISNLTFTSGILIGDDGTLYLASGSTFYALDSEGKILWKSDIGSNVIGNPIIGSDGVIYLIAEKAVVALGCASLKSPDINLTVEDIFYGENATVKISLDEQCTGTVTIKINNESCAEPIVDGTLTKILSDLKVGSYTVDVSYSGDLRFEGQNISTNFTVKKYKMPITLIIESGNIDVGDIEIINVTVPKDVKGNITLTLNNQYYTMEINKTLTHIPISDLTAGEYTAVVNFTSEDYLDCENSTTFAVSKVNLPKDVLTVSDEVVFTINLPLDAAGSLDVTVNDRNYTKKVSAGIAQVILNDLSSGNYTAHVLYSGDDKYENIAFDDVEIVIDRLPANMSVGIDDVSVGQDAVMNITLDFDATGIVLVDIGAKKYYGELENGKTSLNIFGLDVGNYTAVVKYLGDENYGSAIDSVTFKVNPKKHSDVVIDVPSDIKDGGDADVTITIPGASGKVSVIYDGVEDVVYLDENGTVAYTIPEVTAGEHSVVVIYGGDEIHDGAHAVKTFCIEEFATRFTDIALVDGKLTAILANQSGDGLANVPVTVSINGADVNVTTDAKGLLAIENVLGKYIELSYEGSDTLLPTDVSIDLTGANPVRDSTAFVSSDFEQYACDFYEGERGGNFTFQLTDSQGKPLANKTVFIGYNGVTYNRTTDKNGNAALQINLKNAGVYTFVIVFLGDENCNATMAVHKITVNKKPITINAPAKSYKASAKTKKYTVTLKTTQGSSADGKTYLAKGKKLTLTVNGKTYTAKTNANGQATFSLQITKKGKYAAAIKFEGDATYSAANKSVKITVK